MRKDHEKRLTQEAERLQKLIEVQPTADITSITTQIYETNLKEFLLTELAVPAFVQKYDGMNLENGAQNIS